MAFFQNSVLNRHLKTLNIENVEKLYQKFTNYFHNPEIQQNIRDAKEEQFQEGFLRELFVNILGYNLNPQPDYNLTTEFKNETGSKKADGAILLDDKAIAVIELKGTETTDLSKINDQAFSYKNNQSDCIYVITSNFEKLRFFIHNSVEHIEFNLFTLTEDEFNILFLCLSAESIFKDIPLKIKEQSLLKEEDVTKQLYKDYTAFKTELWQNMVKNMPDSDQLILFKRAQKLLDRFLFIFFAEDSGLLPPNSISRIVENWKTLEELDAYKPLYEIFKQYFGYINTGRKGKKTIDDIFEYNGGLFLPDDILDNALIDDEVIHPHVMKLTNYDFNSEIDVNILGHIFENSLNEIENITAKLEGHEVDKKKTKRKKDGVYYTPKYITKYIVENTVGRLCAEKKEELGIIDEEYAKGRAKRKNETILRLEEKLKTYRNWLLGITICDPACGSGAFLNQALEFLINEHRYIDELKAQLYSKYTDSFIFQELGNEILEKNIYGVDINEESVEIAKLSLWLRTAKRGRQLTTLNDNIKCGNSLIDDPEVAGNKAFKWKKEFPEVFKNGGFDVVIGNPPYLSNKDMHYYGMLRQIEYWNKKYYSSKSGNYDIFIPFIEQALTILKNGKLLSFIVPNKFLSAKYSRYLLKLISEKYNFIEVVDYSDINVFDDASVYPIIITLSNSFNSNFPNTLVDRIIVREGAFEKFGLNRKWDFISLKFVDSLNKNEDEIISKIESSQDVINENLSFEPGINGFQFTNYSICVSEVRKNEDSKRLTVTGSIDPHIFNNKVTRYKRKDYKEPYITYDSEIISEGKWRLFCKPKVMVAGMTKLIEAALDINGEYAPAVSVYSICGTKSELYNVQVIINSRLINWFFKYKFSDKHMAGGYISVNNILLQQIPFRQIKDGDKVKALAEMANRFRLRLENLSTNFINLLSSRKNLNSLSKKLQIWHELEFNEFLSELKKKKVKLSLSEEAEWMEYFNEQKAKALELKAEIDKTDKEIDQMVYELYELTPEEIRIVEGESE